MENRKIRRKIGTLKSDGFKVNFSPLTRHNLGEVLHSFQFSVSLFLKALSLPSGGIPGPRWRPCGVALCRGREPAPQRLQSSWGRRGPADAAHSQGPRSQASLRSAGRGNGSPGPFSGGRRGRWLEGLRARASASFSGAVCGAPGRCIRLASADGSRGRSSSPQGGPL